MNESDNTASNLGQIEVEAARVRGLAEREWQRMVALNEGQASPSGWLEFRESYESWFRTGLVLVASVEFTGVEEFRDLYGDESSYSDASIKRVLLEGFSPEHYHAFIDRFENQLALVRAARVEYEYSIENRTRAHFAASLGSSFESLAAKSVHQPEVTDSHGQVGATRRVYLDFDLEISPGQGREYPVAVLRSPAGEARETMRFPFDDLELENQILRLENALLRSGGTRRQVLSPDQQAVQDFGRRLFDSLFAGEVRARYDVSRDKAEQQGKGVRLRLRVNAPDLAVLPWEFMYDARQAEYVCLSTDTPLVRYLELPRPTKPLALAPPLRILGMIASPAGLEPLDVTREKRRVEEAVGNFGTKGLVELIWLEGQTWRDLHRAMQGGPWHIFHFVGHGGFDQNSDEGLIMLSGDDGQQRYLWAKELARLLADHSTLRLAVLNSCDGASGSKRDVFSSTASILLRRGVPAVLAMQYQITDRAAVEFARSFYEGLTGGVPLDAAVTEARKAVSLEVSNSVEWGTPVLYMRSSDGLLFTLQETSGAAEQPSTDLLPSQKGMSSAPGVILAPPPPVDQLLVKGKKTLLLSEQEIIRIGRAPDNDLSLSDPSVDPYHAIVRRVGMDYYVRDLEATNGTSINGIRIPPEKDYGVCHGDRLQIGGTILEVVVRSHEQSLRHGFRLDVLHLSTVISVGRSSRNLLQDISFSINPCEFVALVGTSGAGKSALMNVLNGIYPATNGKVLINGVDLYAHFQTYRMKLGFVPQGEIVHRELTVYEALVYAAKLRMPKDMTEPERDARIDQVLRKVDLDHRRHVPIRALSGGQRIRVSLGVELLAQPRLLLLDEATSGLDPGAEMELVKLLRELTEYPDEAPTIVHITHATKNVMLCDQLVFLTRGGHLAFFGPPDEALQYFDGVRSQTDKYLKPDFEFDDIYGLVDPDRSLSQDSSDAEKQLYAADWTLRYRRSPFYRKYVEARLREGAAQPPAQRVSADPMSLEKQWPPVSSLQQFAILFSRSAMILRRSPSDLLVTLLLAPVMGLFSLINLGQGIFDPVRGSPNRALNMIFLAVIIAMLFGTINSARDISRERSVHQSERRIGLGVWPYVMSKIAMGSLLCSFQVAVYLALTLLSVDWPNMFFAQWGAIYLTLVLAGVSGVLLGLLISAISSNEGQAVSLIPVILIPQFLFAGVLMPELAGTPLITQMTTSKWAVGALAAVIGINLSGWPSAQYFTVNVATAWLAIVVIMIALMGAILAVQIRKDRR